MLFAQLMTSVQQAKLIVAQNRQVPRQAISQSGRQIESQASRPTDRQKRMYSAGISEATLKQTKRNLEIAHKPHRCSGFCLIAHDDHDEKC